MSAKPEMTPAQARGTHPLLTAFMTASAGTGKTHVLTARVLRLMLTGTDPERILCLTFTKAAAAEMTTRIFAELGRWTVMEEAELISEIQRRTQETADKAMLERARSLFAMVLDLSGGMRIMTFHSFCQSLLGRFPLEAGLSPGFEAMEEGEAARVMQNARDRILAASHEDGQDFLRRALQRVAVNVTENTFAETMQALVFELPRLAAARRYYGNDVALFAALYKALDLTPGLGDADICTQAVADARLPGDDLRRIAQAMQASTNANERARGEAIAEFVASPEEVRATRFDTYSQFFLTAKDEPRKVDKVILKATREAYPDVLELFELEQHRIEAVVQMRKRLKLAEATVALLTIGLAQLGDYDRLKTSRGLLDFDDMIRGADRLLKSDGVADWVLYKLDGGIDHILVDEAQDTNRQQWDIIEALASDFFAGEGARGLDRTIFAVGDVKQSIYSFQRADPAEFIAAEGRILQRAAAAGNMAERVPLDLSFRSTDAVLAAVDATFASETASSGLGLRGQNMRHDFERRGVAGMVSLWPLFEADERDEPDHWIPPTRQEEARGAEEKAAHAIARHIERMIRTGAVLESEGRPVEPGDFLILVRRRTAFVGHLTRALKKAGIPVAGRDRMVLTEELPVKDLIVLGEVALQPHDDLSLATMLKGPLFNMSEEALFTLAFARSGSLFDALRRRAGEPDYGPAYARLRDYMAIADALGPFEFYSRLLEEFGGRHSLAGRLGSDCHDPIDEFLAAAQRFEQTQAISLRGFLSSLTLNPVTLKRDFESTGNRVRIMTVHASKGLQAPIVFLSDTTSLPDQRKDARLLPWLGVEGGPELLVWSAAVSDLPALREKKEALKARQLEEYRRLLYVAMTRAEDRLYVTGWRGRQELDDISWYALVREGMNRLEGCSEDSEGRLVFQTQQRIPAFAPEKAAEGQAESRLPAWLHSAKPHEPVPPKPLAPSRPDMDEPAAQSPTLRAASGGFRRGRIIHQLLEFLPDIHPSGRGRFIEEWLAKPAHRLSEIDRNGLSQKLLQIVSDPDFAPIYGPDSRAEVPICGSVYGRQVVGQIDRLVIGADKLMLVDYKTNRPPPGEAEGVNAAYLIQMGLYRALLRGVFPEHDIESYILWTESVQLMHLPDRLLDNALAEKNIITNVPDHSLLT